MRRLVFILAALISLTSSASSAAPPEPRGEVDLFEGWNLAADWTGPATEGVDEVIAFLNGAVAPPVWQTVAWYDGAAWLQTFEQAPLPSFNTLASLDPGQDYWLFATGEATLTLAAAGPGDFRLNEVAYLAAEGEAPYAELTNVSDGLATFAGLTLQAGDAQFVLPAGTVAAGGAVLVSFDGGAGVEGTLVHAPDADFLPADGALVLSREGATLDRIAWGPGQPDAVNPSRGGKIADWQPGASIGRVPGKLEPGPSNWVGYSPAQATPGAPNQLPAAEVLLPFDGAIVPAGPVAVSWYAVPGATSYAVEIASDADFTMLVGDGETTEVRFELDLPAGDYWWRVRAVLEAGDSAYSPVHALTVADEGASRGTSGGVAVPLVFQHKDTTMLLLETTQETGGHAWDAGHDATDLSDPADAQNCVLASVSMVTQWAGGWLSQDRAGYEIRGPAYAGPERDLNWGLGFGDDDTTTILNFGVGGFASYRGHQTLDVFWSELRAEIAAGRPVLASTPTHVFVVTGYSGAATGPGPRNIVINDPYYGTYTTPIASLGLDTYWLLPATRSPFDDRTEVHTVYEDSDGDAINDFDEYFRFNTDVFGEDTDDDDVNDKQDVRASVYDGSHGYALGLGDRDFDDDGLPMERDPDSDDGECKDGQEDLNGDGRFDGGETYNFEKSDDNCFEGYWQEIEHVDETFDDGFVIHRDYEFRVTFEITPTTDAVRGVALKGEGKATFRDTGHAEGGGFCSWVKAMVPDPLTWDLEISGTASAGGSVTVSGDPEQGPPWTEVKTVDCPALPPVTHDTAMEGPTWPGVENVTLDSEGVYDHREDLPLRHPDPFDQGGTLSGEHYIEVHIERKGGED